MIMSSNHFLFFGFKKINYGSVTERSRQIFFSGSGFQYRSLWRQRGGGGGMSGQPLLTFSWTDIPYHKIILITLNKTSQL